eukprot:9788682-Prorocentrum_lima.AAC.1
MLIRRDGATRRSAPFAIEIRGLPHEPEEDLDLVDLDEEQPLMAYTGEAYGLPMDALEEQEQDPSNRQDVRKMK